MARLDHHHDAERAERLLEVVGDLLGEPLLELRTLGVELQDPRELRDADDPVARDVGDVRLPVERHQVVGAEGVERDPPLHDHGAVMLVVREGGDGGLGALAQALEHLEIEPGDPEIGVAEIWLVEVEVELGEDGAHVARDPPGLHLVGVVRGGSGRLDLGHGRGSAGGARGS